MGHHDQEHPTTEIPLRWFLRGYHSLGFDLTTFIDRLTVYQKELLIEVHGAFDREARRVLEQAGVRPADLGSARDRAIADKVAGDFRLVTADVEAAIAELGHYPTHGNGGVLKYQDGKESIDLSHEDFNTIFSAVFERERALKDQGALDRYPEVTALADRLGALGRRP